MNEILVNGAPIRYDRMPVDYMADALRAYFEHGIAPSSFMIAVLSNDLIGACANADDTNRRNLWEWAAWLYNHAPRGSYGSPENVRAWMAAREKERE